MRREQNRAIAHWDVDELAESIGADTQTPSSGVYDYLTLYVSICSDAGRRLDDEFLNRSLEDARSAHTRIYEAEVWRAIGLARTDARALEEAHRIFAACGALPYAARTQCERAILAGDRTELDAGLSYLESIRDEAQVERYLRTAASIS